MRVNKFLEAVDKIAKCAGIKDRPDATIKSSQGYRFFSTHVSNGKPSNKCVIRASGCLGGVQGKAICGPCSKLDTSLNAQENPSPHMLHPKTPLKCVPQTTLIKHFKVIREENRKLQSLVDSLSRGKIMFSSFIKGETASVADDVGEGLFATLQSCKSGNTLMDRYMSA